MLHTSSTLTVKYYTFIVTRSHPVTVFILCVQLKEDLFLAKLQSLVSLPQQSINDKLLLS
jgi:hypothetical protein